MNSTNLCDTPWIPVAGESERKSLIQLFSEPSLRRLSGNAVDKIVILRFLLCLVHASCRIPDEAAWHRLTPDKISTAVLSYLKDHHDCFYLYGEKPFLQFPRLAEIGGEPASPGALIVNVAEGNKVVFTEWNQFHLLSEAETIILLMRSTCFSCGGKKFDQSLILSPGKQKSPTGKGGALLGFMGYLHSYLLGTGIIDTLRMNLLTEKEIQEVGTFPAGLGTPFWENMPQGEEDERALEYSKSYFGQLFPLDKFLLLKEKGIIKTEGISYPGHKEGMVDPAIVIKHDGKNARALWAKTTERPWRELPALLEFLKSTGSGQPFLLSMGLHKLQSCPPKTLTIWAGGVSVSSNSGEQYLSGKNDYVESEFSFSVQYLGTDGFTRFSEMMLDAETTAKRLYACVAGYFRKMNSDMGSVIADNAKQEFWERLELRAQTILDLAFSEAGEEAIRQEKKEWFLILCRIFDENCPHRTPRQMEAWVEANPRFQSHQKGKEVR